MVTKLKIARIMKEIPQWKLAFKVGISQTELSHYEVGRRKPSYETKMLIAKALECKLEDVFPTKED